MTYFGQNSISFTDTHDSVHQQSTAIPPERPETTSTIADDELDIQNSSCEFEEHKHLVQETVLAHDRESLLNVKPRPLETPKIEQLTHAAIQSSDIIAFESNDQFQDKAALFSKATQSFTTNKALEVMEDSAQQNVAPFLLPSRNVVAEQKQQIQEANAIQVATEQFHIKEGSLSKFIQPNTERASTVYDLHNPILVSDVLLNESEKDLPNAGKSNMHQAVLNIVTSDYVSTLETHSGETTDKFYPEVIVATEIAQPNVNSLHEYTTQMTNVVEVGESFDTKKTNYRVASAVLPQQNYMTQQQPLTIEEVSAIIEKPAAPETAKTQLVENAAIVNYETIIMQGEEVLNVTEPTSVSAKLEFSGLSVASVIEATTNDMESCLQESYPSKAIHAFVGVEEPNIVSEQSLVTSNETYKLLQEAETQPQTLKLTTQQAFAYNTEETTTFGSISEQLHVSQNLHKAESTTVEHESKELADTFSPQIKGKKKFKPTTQTHTQYRLFHKQTTHTKPKKTRTSKKYSP